MEPEVCAVGMSFGMDRVPFFDLTSVLLNVFSSPEPKAHW